MGTRLGVRCECALSKWDRMYYGVGRQDTKVRVLAAIGGSYTLIHSRDHEFGGDHHFTLAR